MMKKILTFIFFALFIYTHSFAYDINDSSYHITNSDSGFDVVINDEAGIISDDEELALSNDMYPLSYYGNVVFLSTNRKGNGQHQIAHDYYYDLFNTESGTLLLIDMYERIVYIYSDGANLKTVTNSKAELITDNIYSYLGKAKYYEGSANAFSQVYTLLEGGKIAEPMRYISNIFVSTIIGFSITFIYAFKKSRISSATKAEVLEKTKIKFIINKINPKKNGERKVRCYDVSTGGSYGGHSSGGGHSAGHSASHSAGHSSHSSHSSGGGGGHRF